MKPLYCYISLFSFRQTLLLDSYSSYCIARWSTVHTIHSTIACKTGAAKMSRVTGAGLSNLVCRCCCQNANAVKLLEDEPCHATLKHWLSFLYVASLSPLWSANWQQGTEWN